MPLTEAQVRNPRPIERPYKLYDAGGLYLLVTPTGDKLWRRRFIMFGVEKLQSLGKYPEVGLAEARKKRNASREKVEEGVDPTAAKREARQASRKARPNLFKAVAREWHEVRKHEWTPKYAEQIWTRLEVDVLLYIGNRPIAEIKPTEVLQTLKRVEARGVLVTLRRLKQYCSAIFRFGIASGYCEHDASSSLRGALKSPPRSKRHKALPARDAQEFFEQLEAYEGEPETRIGIKLALLMVPRTTELRAAEWREFEHWIKNADKALWRIPAERMKMGEMHLVPISTQARELLLQLHELTGHQRYFFPGDTNEGVMSNNTMLFAIYGMGFKGRTTTHGFRGMFSTEANENGWNSDWIEAQLAHDERDASRAAYNSAKYLPQRRQLLQWWADHLDVLKRGEAASCEDAESIAAE